MDFADLNKIFKIHKERVWIIGPLQEHSCPATDDSAANQSRLPGSWKTEECQAGM